MIDRNDNAIKVSGTRAAGYKRTEVTDTQGRTLTNGFDASFRRSFTDEYKAQAVAFVIDDRRPVAEVARNIGVHEMTLGKWVKKARESGGDPAEKPLDASERVELERLRAENAELQMQVEFAKKVATWFAKGKQ